MPFPVGRCVMMRKSEDPSNLETDMFFLTLMGKIFLTVPGCSPIIARLQAVIRELRAAGLDHVKFVCPDCVDESRGDHIVFGTLHEYYNITALEKMGQEYYVADMFRESFESFKIAILYYRNHFGRRSPVSRQLTMKMARTLLHWGQHQLAVTELKGEAEHEEYADPDDACATIHIRFVYGLSLVRLRRKIEAVPFLVQPYFGVMDLNLEFNVQILEETLILVLRELSLGSVYFGICMYRLLSAALEPRFVSGGVPMAYIEFCAYFSYVLKRQGKETYFSEVYREAEEMCRRRDTPERRLQLWAMGCAFQEGTGVQRESLKEIVATHEFNLSVVSSTDKILMRKLEATTKFIYVWAEKELALATLKKTYRKIKALPQQPLHLVNFCLKAMKQRKRTNQ